MLVAILRTFCPDGKSSDLVNYRCDATAAGSSCAAQAVSGSQSAVQRWDVVYYRKNPCHILRGSHRGPLAFDYTGMDEAKVIAQAARIEDYTVLGDFCMGQGLVGLAAYDAGKPFVGTELNPRRLAVLLQKLAKRGAVIKENCHV